MSFTIFLKSPTTTEFENNINLLNNSILNSYLIVKKDAINISKSKLDYFNSNNKQIVSKFVVEFLTTNNSEGIKNPNVKICAIEKYLQNVANLDSKVNQVFNKIKFFNLIKETLENESDERNMKREILLQKNKLCDLLDKCESIKARFEIFKNHVLMNEYKYPENPRLFCQAIPITAAETIDFLYFSDLFGFNKTKNILLKHFYTNIITDNQDVARSINHYLTNFNHNPSVYIEDILFNLLFRYPINLFFCSLNTQSESSFSYMLKGMYHLHEKNLQEAYNCFEQAKNLGSPHALAFLSCFYRFGCIVEKNDHFSSKLMYQAAEKQVTIANYEIARTEKKEEIKYQYLKRMIDMEFPPANYLLAEYYLKKNNELSANYALKAVDNGYLEAYNILGKISRECRLDDKAFSYFAKAAKTNDTAKFNLAVCYLNHIGTESDNLQALYYLNSITNPHIYGYAVGSISYLYLSGYPVAYDPNKSFEYLSTHYKKLSGLGLYNLACCYMKGYGTNVDVDHAKTLLREAVDKGFQLSSKKHSSYSFVYHGIFLIFTEDLFYDFFKNNQTTDNYSKLTLSLNY